MTSNREKGPPLLHYTDPGSLFGKTYCGLVGGVQVPVPSGQPVQFRNYHETTCPACLAQGPRLYLTEGNGYGVETSAGFILYIKSPKAGSGRVGTPVPTGFKSIQVGGRK